MASILDRSSNRTQDGFVHRGNRSLEHGLITSSAVTSSLPLQNTNFDVIVVGAGFAGLIAARELSLRNRSVLIIEARDRIGGRTFTTEVENEKYEVGGSWIHWSQPHVWTELTRYGLTITETKGVVADRFSALLDNGSRLKFLSMTEFLPQICEAMNKYSDVDGNQGRTVLPLPHNPLTAIEAVQTYDQLSMQDRLDQISESFNNNKELYEIMDAYLSMNSQCKLSDSGFMDHLRWWALGDYEACRLFDKTSRYKINEGTSTLAQAILDDCRNVKLLLSTPIVSVNRTNDNHVTICTQNGQVFTARTTIITIPLNTLQKIEFSPPLQAEKQRAITEGQCRGGSKFSVKLEKPVGNWSGYAPYPSPITMAFTDDEEGTIIIAFGMDDLLDIQDFDAVQRELSKFLPDIQIKYVVGHDWRSDSFIGGTWGWYRPGQMTSNLLTLQKNEPPIFFASSDSANGWRGFIDGAIESGLTTVRHVERYLCEQAVLNK
jgi:monoamine oxidase